MSPRRTHEGSEKVHQKIKEHKFPLGPTLLRLRLEPLPSVTRHPPTYKPLPCVAPARARHLRGGGNSLFSFSCSGSYRRAMRSLPIPHILLSSRRFLSSATATAPSHATHRASPQQLVAATQKWSVVLHISHVAVYVSRIAR